jgi:hypothetical protein
MRALVLAALLASRIPGCHPCNGEDPPPPDARQLMFPPADQRCGAACGNGMIQDCWKTMNSSASVYWTREVCDGTLGVPTCMERGFCGGTARCGEQCLSIDTSQCTPCN